MNILLLTNCIAQPDDIDKSVNNLVFSFAEEWEKKGHRVVIINNESKFPYLFYCIPKSIVNIAKRKGNFTVPAKSFRKQLEWRIGTININRIPIFKPYPHSSFHASQYKSQTRKIINYLNIIDFKPDVVTGHWLEPQLQLVNLLGDYYGAKKALVVHGELSNKDLNKYIIQIKNLDVLFFRSGIVCKKMLQTFSELNSIKTEVCFSGIPNRYINEKNDGSLRKSNNITFKIIYVGRLERYKRIDCIIDAIGLIKDRYDVKLEIIGSGPEEERLKRKIYDNNLENSVNLLGKLSRDEAINKMRYSDCFTMISENEVFGLVYLEAMACGCLTIASIGGGIDGIIQDGVNGFLSEQGDSVKLANVYEKIIQMSEQEKDCIRKNAYECVRNYTDSAAADHYLKVICESGEANEIFSNNSSI